MTQTKLEVGHRVQVDATVMLAEKDGGIGLLIRKPDGTDNVILANAKDVSPLTGSVGASSEPSAHVRGKVQRHPLSCQRCGVLHSAFCPFATEVEIAEEISEQRERPPEPPSPPRSLGAAANWIENVYKPWYVSPGCSHAGPGELRGSAGLREALENLICPGCGHRIGWNGAHDSEQTRLGRTDWKTCNHCKHARAALAAEPALKLQPYNSEQEFGKSGVREEPASSERVACGCRDSDAWRCARNRQISTIACPCRCHAPAAQQPPSTGSEKKREEPAIPAAQVCEEILSIMRTYHEQWPNVDTPGGLEHMGDVWSLFSKWERALLSASPAPRSDMPNEIGVADLLSPRSVERRITLQKTAETATEEAWCVYCGYHDGSVTLSKCPSCKGVDFRCRKVGPAETGK